MTRLVRAELLKLRTTQVWFWLLAAVVVVTALVVVGQLAPGDGVRSAGQVASVFTSSVFAYLVVFVLGVLGVTTEFRYQTITTTVLVTPSRWALVTAKMLTYALVGALYALVCAVVQVAVALPWLSALGVQFSWTHDHVLHALVGVFVVVTLFGVIGLGIGALLRNQVVAVVLGLIFLLVVNGIIGAIPYVRDVYPWTPEGASAAILNLPGTGQVGPDGVTLSSGAVGVLVLLLWAVVPAVIGAALTLDRDIT